MSQMSNGPTAQRLACVLHSVLAVCGTEMQKFLPHEDCPVPDISIQLQQGYGLWS